MRFRAVRTIALLCFTLAQSTGVLASAFVPQVCDVTDAISDSQFSLSACRHPVSVIGAARRLREPTAVSLFGFGKKEEDPASTPKPVSVALCRFITRFNADFCFWTVCTGCRTLQYV